MNHGSPRVRQRFFFGEAGHAQILLVDVREFSLFIHQNNPDGRDGAQCTKSFFAALEFCIALYAVGHVLYDTNVSTGIVTFPERGPCHCIHPNGLPATMRIPVALAKFFPAPASISPTIENPFFIVRM